MSNTTTEQRVKAIDDYVITTYKSSVYRVEQYGEALALFSLDDNTITEAVITHLCYRFKLDFIAVGYDAIRGLVFAHLAFQTKESADEDFIAGAHY